MESILYICNKLSFFTSPWFKFSYLFLRKSEENCNDSAFILNRLIIIIRNTFQLKKNYLFPFLSKPKFPFTNASKELWNSFIETIYNLNSSDSGDHCWKTLINNIRGSRTICPSNSFHLLLNFIFFTSL